MADVKRIATVQDAIATRDLRAKILGDEQLSRELGEALGAVLEKHGFQPTEDMLVTLEPTVTRRVEGGGDISNLPAGTDLMSMVKDRNSLVHVVETRSVVRAYAPTASAWL